MCLNPVNEEFDRAYANVGLLASDVWSYQSEEVNYKKANLNLWLRFNETEKRLIEDDSSDDLSTSTETVYTVQDVIPFSRLATYNNFEYNERREKMYVFDDEPPQYIQSSYHLDHKYLEVWMLPEVEREFKRYIKCSQPGWCMLSPRYPSGRELVSVERIANASPQQWLCETQWPNRLLSHYAERLYSLKLSTEPSLFRIDLEPPMYDPEEVEMKLLEYPCPRYLIETNIDHRLHDIVNSPTIRNLWISSSYPYGSYSQNFGLNAEVPEFQPDAFSSKLKEDGDDFYHMTTTQIPTNVDQTVHGFTDYESTTGARQQHYVSIFDNNYIKEIFPYSSKFEKCNLEPETLLKELNEELLSNSRLYFNLELLKSNWKNEEGSSLSKLVAPQDSEMIDIVEHQLEPWTDLGYDQAYNKGQNTERMIAFLEKWVSKIYNPRSSDFNHMNSSSSRINKIFQNVQQDYCLVQGPIPIQQPPVNRPLYSDVLMSEVTPSSTISESKFDELEQEALEQYSGSDTTLLISTPQNTISLQKKKQDSEKANSNENSTSRQYSDDLRPAKRSSLLGSAERRHGVRPGNLTIRESSQESVVSKRSCKPGSERDNEIELYQDACYSIKQVNWMKKKKKKAEKKKKNCKHNKKKQPLENLLNHNRNRKLIESEIILINKYLGLTDIFKQIFLLDGWKLVQEYFTVQVRHSFETCLSMFEDCLEWFMFLITQREDSSEDFPTLVKHIDLTKKINSLSENILKTLEQYIYLYSKLKMTIPCDHRLLCDPNTLIKQTPILPPELNVKTNLGKNSFFYKVGLLATIPNGKYLLKLLNSVIKEERLSLTFKHEWKLPLVPDTPFNRKSYEIQINFKEWRIHLTESEMEKEEPNSNTTNKLVKIVEDYPTWHSYQWKFIDGWRLDMSDSTSSFHWCNRFNVKILEQIATSARLFVMYDWLLDLINAVVLNKNYPSCEVLWNRKIPNLVSSKMVFFKLLLQKERNWYFGDIRINQQACCRLYSGCENPCCVTWMLNYDSINTGGPDVTLIKAHNSRVPRVTVRSTRQKCKQEETKNKNISRKSKSNSSPENQMIFKDIQRVNNEINLPQGRSSCAIQ